MEVVLIVNTKINLHSDIVYLCFPILSFAFEHCFFFILSFNVIAKKKKYQNLEINAKKTTQQRVAYYGCCYCIVNKSRIVFFLNDEIVERITQ